MVSDIFEKNVSTNIDNIRLSPFILLLTGSAGFAILHKNERAGTCHNLAEVVSYNKDNIERVEQNESRQHDRQQSRTKQREEELL